MAVPEGVYGPQHGGIFVQEAAGKKPYYIGACYDSGDLPKPKGGKSTIWCMDENRQWQPIGTETTAPGDAALSLTGVMQKTADWLEKFIEENCPFYITYMQSRCGERGKLKNWERTFSYDVYQANNDTVQNITMREPSGIATRMFDLDVNPQRIDSRLLYADRQTTTETEAGRDVWACDPRCLGDCGDEIGLGEHIQVGVESIDSPTVEADVLYTEDDGATWAAAAAQPFAAGESIVSGVCIPFDKDTTRWLVVRDTDATAPLEVAYSDDGGATWTLVTVGTTNGEEATGPQSLFALDSEHIWLATDQGTVFFSDDAGVTWTDQEATTPSGGNALNAVHFVSANIGYAVGDSDTIISTNDGGTTWTAETATGNGNNLDTVQCFGQYEVIVGDDGGYIAKSWDGTTNWTNLYGGNAITCLAFSTPLTGLMIDNSAAPVGTLYHTIDGGYSWREMEGGTPTNVGLNSVIMLRETLGYAVGDAQGGTTVIIRISG